MATTTTRRRRASRSNDGDGSSLETRSTRRFEDVSDVLAYDARAGSNARERRSNGNFNSFRILSDAGDDDEGRARAGARGREYDARMNPAYETAAVDAGRGATGARGANEGKFDATSLLALLGEQYDLKRTTSGNTRLEAKPVAKRSVDEAARDAARDEMDENAKPTATKARRTTPEYEFVMIGREETKTKASASKVVRFNANESSIVGDSGSPAVATTAATETRAAPWSKAVVERESSVSYAASRGGGVKAGGGIRVGFRVTVDLLVRVGEAADRWRARSRSTARRRRGGRMTTRRCETRVKKTQSREERRAVRWWASVRFRAKCPCQ